MHGRHARRIAVLWVVSSAPARVYASPAPQAEAGGEQGTARSRLYPVLPTVEITGSTEEDAKLRASAAFRFGLKKPGIDMMISPFLEGELNGGTSVVAASGRLPDGTERADAVRFGGHVDLLLQGSPMQGRVTRWRRASVAASHERFDEGALGDAARTSARGEYVESSEYLKRMALKTCLDKCESKAQSEDTQKFCAAHDPLTRLPAIQATVYEKAFALSRARAEDRKESTALSASEVVRREAEYREASEALEKAPKDREQFVIERASGFDSKEYCSAGAESAKDLDARFSTPGSAQDQVYVSIGASGGREQYKYLSGMAALVEDKQTVRPFAIGVSAGGIAPLRTAFVRRAGWVQRSDKKAAKWAREVEALERIERRNAEQDAQLARAKRRLSRAERRAEPLGLGLVVDGFLGYRKQYAPSEDKVMWCQPAGTLEDIAVERCKTGVLGGPASVGRVSGGFFVGVLLPRNGFARVQIGPTASWARRSEQVHDIDLGIHAPITLSFLESVVGKDAEFKGLLRIIPSLRLSQQRNGAMKSDWNPAFLLIVELRLKRSFFMQALDWL